MIGAHELLLIVRAQNQASAALGRVGNDIRRLQAQRDLAARGAAVQTRIAAQNLRLMQIESSLGSKNIAVRRAQLQIENQIAHVKDRNVLLEQRRAAIVARGNNLLAQQERYENRILGLEGKRISANARILRSQAAIAATEAKIAALSPGGVGRQGAQLTQYRARTGIDQATLNQMVARRRLASIRSSETLAGTAVETEQALRVGIANRRLEESKRAYAIAAEGVKALDREIKVLKVRLTEQNLVLDRDKLALRDLKVEETELNGAIQRLQDSWSSLSARERAVQATEAQHSRQLAELQLRMEGVKAQALEMGAAAEAARADIGRLGMEMDAIATERQVQRMERMRTIFASMSHVGRVAQMFGLVGTAAVGYAAVQAAQFQTQATLAATQARRPGGSIASVGRIASQVQGTILKQMQQFPATADDMNKALYDIFSGTNIRNMKQASDMLSIFNKEAVAGGTDLDTMVQAGITLFNNFPTQFKNATQAGNAFFAMVRFGRGNAKDFADSLAPIIPIAKQAGQSVNEVFGELAAASRVNPNLKQNAQGYARLLLLLARPDVVAGFKKIGVNVLDAQKHVRGLVDIAAEVPDRFKKSGTAAINMIKELSKAATGRGTQGTIQAQRFWANLLTNVRQYRIVMGQVAADHAEFIDAYKALSQTPGVQWKVLTNQIKALVIILGQQALPIFIAIGKHLSNLIAKFNALSPHTKRLIGEIAAIVSIATLLGGTLLTVVGGIGVFLLGLRTVGQMFGIVEGKAVGTKGALIGLEGEVGAVSLRAGVLLGSVGLLIIAFTRFHSQTMTVINYLGGLGHVVAQLSLLFAAWKTIKAIQGIDAITAASTAATGEVAGLSGALAGLSAMGPILVPITMVIGYEYLKGFTGAKGRSLGVKMLSGASRLGSFLSGAGSMFPGVKAVSDVTKAVIDATAPSALDLETGVSGAAGLTGAAARARRHGEVAPIVAARAARAAAQARAAATRANTQKLLGQTTGHRFDLEAAIANVEALHAAAIRTHSMKTWTNYYTALAALQKRYSGAQLQAVNELLNQQNSAATKAAKTLGVTFQDVLSSLQSKLDTFVSQEQGIMGTLFQGPFAQRPFMQNQLQYGYKMTGADLLKDAKSQIVQARSIHTNINRLAKQGAPKELIDQVMQLAQSDPKQAIERMQALEQLNPKQLRAYFNTIRQQQKLIHQYAMGDLQRQLKDYNKYGKNIALQIVAGLRSEEPAMTKALTSMVKKMFPGLPVGETGAGGKPTHHRPPATTTNHNDNSITVHVSHDGMSTKKQIEQAAWAAYVKMQKHRH